VVVVRVRLLHHPDGDGGQLLLRHGLANHPK
jgi:hypothetical protein